MSVDFFLFFFFFKQTTAYEMRIIDWSSDVCSSDLVNRVRRVDAGDIVVPVVERRGAGDAARARRGDEVGVARAVQRGADEAGDEDADRAFEVGVRRRESSEERRVGDEWVRTCRYRWSPDQLNNKKIVKTQN